MFKNYWKDVEFDQRTIIYTIELYGNSRTEKWRNLFKNFIGYLTAD